MMANMLEFAKRRSPIMRAIAISLLLAATCTDASGADHVSDASDLAPERPKSTPKRNFLADATELTSKEAETAAKEHAFFERLSKEGANEDLLEALRVNTYTEAKTSRIGIPSGG